MSDPHVIPLHEYRAELVERSELPADLGEALWRQYSTQVAVDFPSPKTGGKWQLTSQGYVGHIPLSPELSLLLQPKVPVINIFRMLEYAFGLKSFRFLDGLAHHETLLDVYERLAHVLAKRVSERVRQGLHRSYEARSEALPYVRGRLETLSTLRRPWSARLHCHYHRHTPDIEDNQILAWTLHVLRRRGLQRSDVRAALRRAAHSLQGGVTLQSFGPVDCTGRTYSRLSLDYQPMHALCRFFLDSTGPSLECGAHAMLPFLIDMAGLFERFVAAWIEEHLPEGFGSHKQYRHAIASGVQFHMDQVLYRRDADQALGPVEYVLDTKYKAAGKPAQSDIYQITAYALAKRCREAVLVYPAPLDEPLDAWVGDVHVRSLVFSIGGDLDRAGGAFLSDLQTPPQSPK